MSLRGTDSHTEVVNQLPQRVAAATQLAASHGFPLSCRREQGRLLFALAQGARVRIEEHAPFDLLILDGGGHGKNEPPIDPAQVLTPGGIVVIDDFTPADQWPPLHEGLPDQARMWWLEHPALRAVELRLAYDLSTVVATRRR